MLAAKNYRQRAAVFILREMCFSLISNFSTWGLLVNIVGFETHYCLNWTEQFSLYSAGIMKRVDLEIFLNEFASCYSCHYCMCTLEGHKAAASVSSGHRCKKFKHVLCWNIQTLSIWNHGLFPALYPNIQRMCTFLSVCLIVVMHMLKPVSGRMSDWSCRKPPVFF